MTNPAKLLRGLVAALSIVLALFVPTAYSQQGQTSTGTDFWIGFMPNYLTPATNIRIFIASGTRNRVQVDVYGDSSSSRHFTNPMSADDIWTLTLPNPELGEERVAEKAEYKAIHVYSDNPVAVYGLSNVSTTTDSYLALPTPTLGTEYYASCFYDDNYIQLSPSLSEPLAGEFLIVAPYDNTIVTIGPVRADTRSDPQGTLSHSKGDTWTVKLMRGQTYLVQSTGLKLGDADLTGTHIVSTKPVSLISGHQRCRIPVDGIGNSKDHIMEMIPPLSAWGKEYYMMPQGGRTACGDYVRIIAGEDNVTVTANGQVTAQLNHGDFVDRELVLDPTVYKSNGKKFLVVDHSYSAQYNGDPSATADPFSIVMTPREQFQKKMLFRVPNNVAAGTQYENFVTFICRADSIKNIQINGKRIVTYQFAGNCDSFPGTSPAIGAYRIKVPSNTATYIATCGAPFAAYLYGFSYAESYGHPAGIGVRLISPDSFPPLARIIDSACGTYHVRVSEPRPVDTWIAEVAMITESGDLRWAKPSVNFAMTADSTVIHADSALGVTLSVIDPTKDAYAAIYTTDRAGNDTVYQYYYNYAPKITFSPHSPYDFAAVLVDDDSCRTITITNASTQPGAITIDTISVEGKATGGNFSVTPKGPQILLKDSSLSLKICFAATDTLEAYDTLSFTSSCIPFALPLKAIGATPLIVASDLDFGQVRVGDTICKDLLISNPGKAPLTVTGQDFVRDADFSFTGAFPLTIAPHAVDTITYCFHPHASGTYRSHITYHDQNPARFQHSIKDTALLTGTSSNSDVRSEAEIISRCEVVPNPFQNSTTIYYTLQDVSRVTVRVFDVTGRTVRTLTSNEIQQAGAHQLQLDLNDLPRGTYLCALYLGDQINRSAHLLFMTKE